MRLWSSPDILNGEVCVEGTRVPIATLWRYFAVGYSVEHVADEYPSLTLCQINAARDMVKFKGNLKENPDA